MSQYDLEKLGWFNFEGLVRCLCREVIGTGLSAFSGSRDQGRDATFQGKASRFPSETEPWEGHWVIQTKHRLYSSRGAEAVRRELKRTLSSEITKISEKHSIPCDNYVYVTNCPLTSANKDEFHRTVAADHPEIKNLAVLAEADIEELLNNSPRVVSAFPQILGLSQLRTLVQWGLHERSRQYLEAAQSEIAKFVVTEPYIQAVEVIHKRHFCVLSGPPKMGKTCTAYAIAASFSVLGYEVYELRNQKDFYDAFNQDEKQVFICDDVFGDIALNAALRDDWTRSFMRLLRSLGNAHKLLWTAREYILKEAVQSSRLKEDRPDLERTDTVTVAVDRLTTLEKAVILYNHAKNANLPGPVIDFLKSPACIKIVQHTCYSPESIRQLCTGRLVRFSEETDGDASKILEKVLGFLIEPGDAWKSAYLSAHPCEQLVCTEVMAAGGSIGQEQLKNRYDIAVLAIGERLPSFETALSNAVGTFLRVRSFVPGFAQIQFYHPSMRDLMVEIFKDDRALRRSYLKQLTLQELPSIIKTGPRDAQDSSAMHRIEIDDQDVSLVNDHLSETLLPAAKLADVSSVLTEVCSALGGPQQIKEHRRDLRENAAYPSVLWGILDAVAIHACKHEFWKGNLENEYILRWRRLFEVLRVVLPLVSSSSIPVYIPELLRRLERTTNVDYWGLVIAAHSIAPTVVEQCMDMEQRLACREGLASSVEQAIQEAEDLELESDFNDSNYWHDEYGTLAEDCGDYEKMFPDDEGIPNCEKVEQISDDFPCLEEEANGDYGNEPSSSSSSDGTEDILAIFADL